MIELIKKNLATEKKIINEIAYYQKKYDEANYLEKNQIGETINSLLKSVKIINNSIPDLLKGLDSPNKLPSKKESPLQEVIFQRDDSNIRVVLNKRDKESFIRELSISENILKSFKKKRDVKDESFQDFKASRGYLKLSNKFFFNKANEFIKKGYFTNLENDIKKSNFDVLLSTYVSMIIFTTLISIFFGIFLFVFLIFFNIGFDFPFISSFEGDYAMRMLKIIWVPIAVPLITFIAMYFYPGTERGSISKKIESELPFAVIYMSSISGSGIPPSEIFRIIGLSKEYPNLRREIRKVLNQINIYGYDLVTSITNVSKSTPSKKLSELFVGISTTINSGGDLSDFFKKRADTLLNEYRLEREKFIRTAETFMDIYISVVIAAPMILLLLFVIMSITGIGVGFTTGVMTIIIISAVAVINIIFLAFIHVKQPSY